MAGNGSKRYCAYCGDRSWTGSLWDVAAFRALPEGTVITGQSGKSYKIKKVIGRGGSAITYSATSGMFGETYAVKEFFPFSKGEEIAARDTLMNKYDIKSSEGFGEFWNMSLQKFRREEESVKFTSEFNGLKLEDTCLPEDNYGNFYIIMTYVEGESWARHFVKPVGFEEARFEILPVIRCLAKAHANHIYHRDIKPQNIIWQSLGRSVLIDWGNSKLIPADNSEISQYLGWSDGFTQPMLVEAIKGGYENMINWESCEFYSICKLMLILLCGGEIVFDDENGRIHKDSRKRFEEALTEKKVPDKVRKMILDGIFKGWDSGLKMSDLTEVLEVDYS